MPRRKRLSGMDVVSIFEKFGFEAISTRGDHCKLRRVGSDGSKQTLIVPLHREFPTGTCLAIYRQATQYIPENELRPFFYSD